MLYFTLIYPKRLCPTIQKTYLRPTIYKPNKINPIKRQLLTCCLAMCSLATMAQHDEWKNPEINAVNRAPMHTNYFAYSSSEEAAKADKENSSNFMTLNVIWKFNWVKNADARPTDFYRTDYNDKGWGQMKVPGVWEMN